MKTTSIKQTCIIPASAHDVYETLLNSKKHAELIDSDAEIDARIGGKFSMWGGSITGSIVELEPDKKIVELWRSDDNLWPENHFSRLTFELKEKAGQTTVTLSQSDIPETSAAEVAQGWKDFYWEAFTQKFGK